MIFPYKYKLETAQKFIFAFLMIFAVLYSMWLKNDNVYDFQNYHYYNAFAFLNNRLNYDIVPATVNGFFNPLLDLPLYFLVDWFNDYPVIIFGIQGLWFGLLLILVFKICSLMFDFSRPENLIYFIFVALFITTGRAIMPQIGSSTNEIAINAIDLWGLYLLFKMLKFPKNQTTNTFIAAGFIIGCALGLKPTSVCPALVSGIMLICCADKIKNPIKNISIYALCGFLGFMLIHGWFMWQYWQLYGNPFFPFLNGIFHSPYMDNFNYTDNKWVLPFWQTLLAPYIWYFDTEFEPEGMLGYQFLVYCTINYVFLLYLILSRKLNKFRSKNILLFAISIFLFFSFLFWQQLFAIMRYLGIIEVLFAFFSVAIVQQIAKKPVSYFILFLFFIPFVLLNRFNYWDLHNRDPLKKFVDVEQFNFPPNTLIKLYGRKLSFLVPIYAKNRPDIRAMGYYHDCSFSKNMCINGKGSDFAERGEFRKMRNEIEKNHTGPVVIFFDDAHFIPEDVLKKLGDPDTEKKYKKCAKNNKNTQCDNKYHIFESDILFISDLEGKLCRLLDYNLTYDSRVHICMNKDLFGIPEDEYIEVQKHGIEEQ